MQNNLISELIPVLLIVTNLLLLGSSRMRACITLVAAQGIVLGLIPVLLEGQQFSVTAWFLAIVSITLKGIIFPMLLVRTLRETGTRKEVEPFVGFTLSLLIGVGFVIFSMWIASRMSLPAQTPIAALMTRAGLATLLIGLFVIVSRRKALNQVLGYIVMENGIFAFGAALVADMPTLVELGVLLDAFVAVFIMSIAAHQISREFDHIDVDQLNTLKG
ncbi:MAG: NADH-quinone oxidoreductase subunit K [Candidatus Brocadiia bacterium]